MKLTMKNIGVIRDAEIELDGITVLAGYNGTGKSTASKALYGVMASYANLSNKILEERKNSISNIIFLSLVVPAYAGREISIPPQAISSQLYNLANGLANKSRPIPEQYEECVSLLPSILSGGDSARGKEAFPKFLEKLRNAVDRPDTEYVLYLARKILNTVFGAQINTINSPLPGEIALTIGETIRRIKIQENKVVACDGPEINASRPVYLDTGHMLDELNEYEGLDKLPSYIGELSRLLKLSDFKPTFEEYKSRERVQDMIASVIHGKLTTSSFGEFMFKDDNFNEPISLRNIASGNKTFAVLQRLIENGALRENGLLIIDEPESNQHPEWQLKLAETLVLIQRELGVRLFLNTHSTYFLRAIEVYSRQYELSNHCHYYQTQPVADAENLFYIRNVDGNTKLIYRDFYLPFEEL